MARHGYWYDAKPSRRSWPVTSMTEPALRRAQLARYHPPTVTGWVAVAHADRDYYEAATALGDLESPRVPFPRDWPPRTFGLNGDQAWIGRRGRTRGHRPE